MNNMFLVLLNKNLMNLSKSNMVRILLVTCCIGLAFVLLITLLPHINTVSKVLINVFSIFTVFNIYVYIIYKLIKNTVNDYVVLNSKTSYYIDPVDVAKFIMENYVGCINSKIGIQNALYLVAMEYYKRHSVYLYKEENFVVTEHGLIIKSVYDEYDSICFTTTNSNVVTTLPDDVTSIVKYIVKIVNSKELPDLVLRDFVIYSNPIYKSFCKKGEANEVPQEIIKIDVERWSKYSSKS